MCRSRYQVDPYQFCYYGYYLHIPQDKTKKRLVMTKVGVPKTVIYLP